MGFRASGSVRVFYGVRGSARVSVSIGLRDNSHMGFRASGSVRVFYGALGIYRGFYRA